MAKPQQKSLFSNLPKLGDNEKLKELNKKIVEKASQPRKNRTQVARGTTNVNSIAQKLANIIPIARQNLVDDGTIKCVRTEEAFKEYVDKCIEKGICFLDTETTGLDPIKNHMVGICLKTRGEFAIYAPMHHTDYEMNELPDQLSDDFVASQVKLMVRMNVKFVYHNAKFDIRVVRNWLKVFLTVHWCTSLASNYLNENEPHALKTLWNKYCNKSGDPDALKFSELFDGIPFNFVPIDIAYLYAGKDSKLTEDVYEFQQIYLNPGAPACRDKGLYDACLHLTETDIPLIPYLADMEEEGLPLDLKRADELKTKYEKMIAETEKKVYAFLDSLDYKKLKPELRAKLSNPINLNSPPQIAIVLYDVLNLDSGSKKNPRGTGEEILELLKIKYPEYKAFFTVFLEYRGLAKLLSTYIIKMPNAIKEQTGRIHTSFNQYGAKTGRYSSGNSKTGDPNFQNIPSKNKEIRKMIIAPEGEVLLAADYSQQEPRVLAHVADDEEMKKAYLTGKDLYAWVASVVYKLPYEHCLEKHGPDGKKRREGIKSVVLGLMYGRGAQAIADQLDITKQEAQQIIDMFFDAFPKVKMWIDGIIAFAKENGFVYTVWGRKRRLPDIQLPAYEFEYFDSDDEVEDHVADYYYQRLTKASFFQKVEIIADARDRYGIKVIDNGGKIAEAERQAVNSVIQGTGADITSRAMLAIARDEEIRKLGGRLILTVHDEVDLFAPEATARKIADRVRVLMIGVADKISVPMKVDISITKMWSGEASDDITEKLPA